MGSSVVVSAAVEGDLDEAVVRKLIASVGGTTGFVYGRTGKPAIRDKIHGYNNAARHSPWMVLVDLDQDAECAAALRTQWVPRPERNLCFRIAVRQVESWLLADALRLSRFLSVSQGKIPVSPDLIPNAKDAMVSIARQSRRSSVRQDMVPRTGSGRSVGPAYSSTLIEFVASTWQPNSAAKRSESLRRAIKCLERLVSVSGR